MARSRRCRCGVRRWCVRGGRSTAMKLAARALAVTMTALVALSGIAVPAHASAYRYWSYWTWSGSSWSYSTKGPSGTLNTGDVIGWRFAVQADSSHAITPRVGAVSCNASTQIGVVIDYGTTQDAPSGETPPSPALQQTCVSASGNNNGYRATDAAAPIRTNDSGLVCGIDGYPKSECAAVVSSSKPPSAKPTTSTPRSQPHARVRRTHAGLPTAAPVAGQTAQPGIATSTHPAATSAASTAAGAAPTPS